MTAISRIVLAGLLLTLAPLTAQALSLTDAYKLALKHDPSVPLIDAQHAADQQLGEQVLGSLRPNVSVNANYTYDHQRQAGSPFTRFSGGSGGGAQTYKFGSYGAGITASQPLYRFDWSARRRQARALDARADTAYSDRQQQLILRVAQRYFGVLTAQQDLVLAQAEAKSIRESLQDTKKRFSVGVIPGTDLKEAQARDDLAQASLISAREQLNTARDLLAESTGDGAAVLPALAQDTELPQLQPAQLGNWLQQARDHNPGLALAREQVHVARAQLRAAQGSMRPALDAVASYNHNDNSDYAFGQKTDDARIGVQLSMPLYAGGVNRSKVAQARAQLASAEADLASQQSDLLRAVRQNYRQLQTAYTQARAFQIAVDSARAAETATQNGYNAGTRTITDVLNARSAVVQAERNLSGTRYNLLLDWLQLRRQAGDLDAGALQRIDTLLKPEATAVPANNEHQKG